MSSPNGLQVLQTAIVLLAAPLYAGLLGRAAAIVQSKRGPSIWQPYRDLRKLLQKGSAVSEHASWVFRGAPFVAFACYLTVSAIVPIITDEPLPLAFLADLIGGAFVLGLASFAISLAALDTASPLGGLGSSRTTWVGSLAEPATVAGILVAADGASNSLTLGGDVVGRFTVQAQPLASPFIALLGVIAVAIALYAPRYHRPEAATAVYLASYNLALLASLVVLVAGSAVVFLVAWETMALASYAVIIRNHRAEGVAWAGFLFIAMSEVGFALIVAAFAVLAVKTGSMDFSVMATRSGHVPAGWQGAVFVLALLGFGFKAGIVPLHIWLPVAHPAAAADGSAYLSGMVLKLGIYGIARSGSPCCRPARPGGGSQRWRSGLPRRCSGSSTR